MLAEDTSQNINIAQSLDPENPSKSPDNQDKTKDNS